MGDEQRRLCATKRVCPGFYGMAVAAGLMILCAPLAALGQDDAESMSLEWYHPVIAGAGVAALFLVDVPVRDYVQDHPSSFGDDIADFTAGFKNGEIFWVSGGGAIAIGLLAREPKVTSTGGHILAAYGLSSAMMISSKWLFGRSRPSGTPDDATNFDWFDGSSDSAFPSGSAAVVFSLATTLADAIDRRPVSVLLYSGAVLNAWARVYSDRHWLSDVVLGALYGITAAKLVNGDWEVFGVELPTIWTDGRSASFGYSIR